jgi:hypothetical protein
MIAKIPDFRLSLFGKELIPVPSAKDLGLLFDPHLSFGSHVVKETMSTTMHLFTFYLESDGMSTNNDYKHFRLVLCRYNSVKISKYNHRMVEIYDGLKTKT